MRKRYKKVKAQVFCIYVLPGGIIASQDKNLVFVIFQVMKWKYSKSLLDLSFVEKCD